MVTAEDKLEILDLISRFSHAFDGGDAEALANVFVENGGYSERIDGTDSVRGQGHIALKEYTKVETEKRGISQPRHHVRNTVFFETSNDRVKTRSYFLATTVAGEGKLATSTASGIYEDTIIRTPAGWRILKRIALYD